MRFETFADLLPLDANPEPKLGIYCELFSEISFRSRLELKRDFYDTAMSST